MIVSPATTDLTRRFQPSLIRVRASRVPFDALHVVHTARRFPPHFHDTYAIGVVESGTCRITTKEGTWLAEPGYVTLFAPEILHSAEVLSTEPFAYRTVYLSKDVAHHLCRTGGGASDVLFRASLPVLAPSPAANAFGAAHRDLMSDPGSSAAEGRMLDSIRELARQGGDSSRASPSRFDGELTAAAQAFFAGHLSHPISLRDLASRFGVSPYRLIRIFGRVTGISPYAWLVLLRVNRARRLLEARAPLSDATYLCGFSDQSHLTRTFRRTFGVPPGFFARAIRAVP